MYQSILAIQDINKIVVLSIASDLKTGFDQGGAKELIADIETGKKDRVSSLISELGTCLFVI